MGRPPVVVGLELRQVDGVDEAVGPRREHVAEAGEAAGAEWLRGRRGRGGRCGESQQGCARGGDGSGAKHGAAFLPGRERRAQYRFTE